MGRIGVVEKQPSERIPVTISYANRLPAGTALLSGTVSAIRMDTAADASSTLLSSTTVTVSETDAVVGLTAGTDGLDYQVTVLMTLDQGSPAYLLEDDFLVQVRAV